jgi:tetratricopeptide (TPR) repeat protein
MTGQQARSKGAALLAAALVAGACGGLATEVRAQEAPKPPSTGREAPAAIQHRLDAQQAEQLIALALEEAGKPNPDCDQVVRALMRALPVVAPRGYKPEYKDAFLAAQTCAARAQHYQTLLTISYMLFLANQAKPHHIVQAHARMGQYDEALKLVKDIGSLYENDPDFAMVRTYAECMKAQFTEEWAGCLRMADRTVELARSGNKVQGLLLGQVFRMSALYFQGRFAEAVGALDEIEKVAPTLPILADLRQYVGWGEAYRWIVEEIFPPFVPLGIYHLYGNDASAPAGSLATLKVYNHATGSLTFKVEVEIPGVTEKVTRTALVGAGRMHKFLITPQLKVGFEGRKLRAERPAQFTYRITAADPANPAATPVVKEDVAAVRLIPPDHLPLKKAVAKDALQYTLEYIAAWVTPNAPAIDPFLARAKERLPDKTFSGEQRDTIAQVKAIYDELQARGVTYVSDPDVVSEVGLVQRTRLPVEVLESTNAQCLEGTILFATLLEAIGLRPVVVAVPGHAFVGWHPSPYDGVPAGSLLFLETTMVGGAPFEAAVQVAGQRVREEMAERSFERGVSFLIDLARLRQRGFTPQPHAN